MTDKLIEQIKAYKADGDILAGDVIVETKYLESLEARILADADRIEALEAMVEALTAYVEKADKMERALRWIGYKSPMIDALPATMQKHARAALEEALKGEE